MRRFRLLVTHADGEPSSLIRELAAHADAPSLDVTAAHPVDVAEARLASERFDAILLGLPLRSATEMGALAKFIDASPDTAVLVVADSANPALSLDAVRHGAQDCLVRDRLAGAPLARIVEFAVERQRRLSELRALSLVDELTGLYNRRGFRALADQQLRLVGRLGTLVSQLFVDLDGLKRINDTLGHPEGDRALVDTAAILRATFRDSDVIARIGGDEFAVLSVEPAVEPGMPVAAGPMAERLLAQLRAHNERSHRPYTLSLSVGVAYYDAQSPSSVSELLAEADAWMYEQKRKKRVA